MIKFELKDFHRNVPIKDLIEDLQRVSLRLNKESFSAEDYKKIGKYHPTTMHNRFGSWLQALVKSGLKIHKYDNIDPNDLLNDLIQVSKRINKKKITQEEYLINGKYSVSPFCRIFGSWFKALEKAGLEKTRNYKITKEEYFLNLEEVWIQLGRQPKYLEMRKPLSKFVGSAYEYKFGTWRKALEKFIEYINVEEKQILKKINNESPSDLPKGHNELLEIHRTKKNISSRLRFIIFIRDNFKCKICGRSPANDPKIILHVDHIKAYSNGGETIPENLQTLCSVCNLGKSNLL